MLANFRTEELVWDKASSYIYESYRASTSDERGRRLLVRIVNGGHEEDLRDYELSLAWEHENNGNSGLDAFKQVDGKEGTYELYYTTGMLSNFGKLDANLYLTNGQESITSEPFIIEVFKGINRDSVESSDSFSTLTEYIARLKGLEGNFNQWEEAENGRVASENERVIKEDERSVEYTKRVNQESERVNEESIRVQSEQERRVAESDREANEDERNDLYDLVQQKLADGEFVGEKGPEGLGGSTPYFHVAYANSADGTVGFSVDDSSGKEYIGQYTSYARTGKGRNLVVRTGELKEMWIAGSGEIVPGTGAAVMVDYIDVSPNQTLTFTKTDSPTSLDGYGGFWGWQWLDENKDFIRRAANESNEFQWVVPSNAHYIQVSYPMDSYPKVEKGSESTPYSLSPEDAMEASTNPEDYSWTKIKGEKGDKGDKGEDADFTQLTKADVGLGNVENVKQASKEEHDQLASDFSEHQYEVRGVIQEKIDEKYDEEIAKLPEYMVNLDSRLQDVDSFVEMVFDELYKIVVVENPATSHVTISLRSKKQDSAEEDLMYGGGRLADYLGYAQGVKMSGDVGVDMSGMFKNTIVNDLPRFDGNQTPFQSDKMEGMFEGATLHKSFSIRDLGVPNLNGVDIEGMFRGVSIPRYNTTIDLQDLDLSYVRNASEMFKDADVKGEVILPPLLGLKNKRAGTTGMFDGAEIRLATHEESDVAWLIDKAGGNTGVTVRHITS